MIDFINEYINIFYAIGQVAALLVAILTVFLWIENIKTRRAANRPLIIPTNLNSTDTNDRLFVYDFEYPLDEHVKYRGISFFGLKNIGKGPTINLKVESFVNKRGNAFSVSPNIINLPEDITVPFVIRFKFENSIDDLEFTTFLTKLSYQDVFKKRYYLSVELWLRGHLNEDESISQAFILRYQNSNNPTWNEFDTVIFREVENHGIWELDKMKNMVKQQTNSGA
ncbi:hypothetical protein [Cohnella abietis]|uniref:Uncharacterized protein n=1 Tax=Cohnella abietis TaxID=2507935 RepID=A0A3T1D6W2_9BACL|nr:hypothetical protein [Cohnella abietis]BBI33805.1 hypothetical protein KCTCHS21_32040 [Cohnella abietis]